MNNYIFHYKRDKPFLWRIIKFILYGICLVMFNNLLWLSLMFGLAATFIQFYQRGIEINFQEKKYRLIISLFTLNTGQWKPLPLLKYISVFRVKLSSTFVSNSGGTNYTQNDTVIQVNLITEDNKRMRIFVTEEKDKAIQIANETALKLNLKIWDATNKEGKWL